MGCVDGSQEERIATGMNADIRSKWFIKIEIHIVQVYLKLRSYR